MRKWGQVLLVGLLAVTVAAADNKDQGMVTSDKVLVIKTPKFYPAVDIHAHMEPSEEAYDLAVKAMDAAGVAASVNLSGSTGERLDAHLALAAKYPGRFVTFCGDGIADAEWSDPSVGKRIAERIEEGHRKGAAGFGEAGEWVLDRNVETWDDPRLEPVWQKLDDLRMPINWHIGNPSRYWRPEGPYNSLEFGSYSQGYPTKQEVLFQQERILQRHPNLVVLAAHANYLTDEIPYLVYRLEKYPNYYVDLGAACDEFGRVPEEFVDLCMKYQDRILYGTDAGYRRNKLDMYGGLEHAVQTFKAFHVAHFLFLGTDQRMIPIPWNGNYGRYLIYHENGFTRYAHDGVALPDDVLAKIYYRNAEKLFGIRVADWKPSEGFTYEVKPAAKGQSPQ
jgi:predicted TIM-barrel fold metal-dependent hydrolase